MEDVVKYLAEIVEFLVGGVLFLGSIALLTAVVATDSVDSLRDGIGELPSSFGVGATLIGVAIVYAVGILAEGLSRMAMEWRLRQITLANLDIAKAIADPAALGLMAGDKTDKKLAEETREHFRNYVTKNSDVLVAKIDDQLKRLRIERTFALSSVIAAGAAVAALIEKPEGARWYLLVLALASLTACLYLVNERFDRFVRTIVSAYKSLNAPPTPAETTAAAAGAGAGAASPVDVAVPAAGTVITATVTPAPAPAPAAGPSGA